MEFSLNDKSLPELAIFEGLDLVSASAGAAEATAIATESAMVTGLRSMLTPATEGAHSEEETLQTRLNSFGFGPMFSVI